MGLLSRSLLIGQMARNFLITLLCLCWFSTGVHAGQRYLIFAAASMKDAMEEVATAFQTETGDQLVLSLAGTSKLARQIDRGAPVDIFISADRQWMDWLIERNFVSVDKQKNIAGNRLVMAVRYGTENWLDPAALLTKGLAAMADPDSIPAGRYAKQALTKMNIWDDVSKNIVRTENVRLALSLVVRGEVEAAIVYRSDVQSEPDIRVAFTFNEALHTPIEYPAGIVKGAKKGADKVLEFLASDTARDIFKRNGFQPLVN